MPQQRAKPTFQHIQILAAAMMICPAIYVVIGIIVNRVNGPFAADSTLDNVLCGLIGVGVVIGLAGFWLRTSMLAPESAKRKSGGDTMAYYARWTIAAMAMAEVPAIVGLVRFLCVAGLPVFAAACAVTFALGFSMFPTRAHYDAMCAGLETIPDEQRDPDAG